MLNIAAVIPARGGSKGIPNKNITDLAGKPLLFYSINCLKESGLNIPIYVSSDSLEILEIAKKNGANPIKRPVEIAQDKSSTESALLHFCDQLENEGKQFDAILTVQPTSPFRKPETIKEFCEKFQSIQPGYDAMLTLHKNLSDFWIYDESEKRHKRLYPNAPRRRQERAPLYVENSCLYITLVTSLKLKNSVLGTNCFGFEIDEIEAIDINEPIDLEFAKAIKNMGVKFGNR